MNWKWVSGIALAVIVLLILTFYIILYNYDYNALKPEISRAVRDKTGRDLTMGGDISLKIGFTPVIVVKDVTFQNAPWGSQPEMVKVKRFEIKVSLLPLISHRVEVKRLVLIQPEILLETDGSGKSNFTFETAIKKETIPPKDSPTQTDENWKLSALTFNEVQIEKGCITLINQGLKKTRKITVNTFHATAAGSQSPVRLSFSGAYNDMPLEVTGNLCPLTAFINPVRAWPVDLAVKANNAVLTFKGNVREPLAGRGIELNFALKGKDLASFRQSSGEPLCLKGPFDISGRIKDVDRNTYSISNLRVIQGESDLSGSLEFTLSEDRPKITASLSGQKLDFRSCMDEKHAAEKSAEKPKEKTAKENARSDKVFSDRPLPLDALRQVDAKISIKAATVLLPNRSIEKIEMGIDLQDGSLMVKPLKAILGNGTMDGYLSVKSQGNVATVATTMNVNKADINFFTKGLKGADAIEGSLDIDIDLRTRGGSIAGLMGELNGRTILIMGKGRINNKHTDIPGGNLTAGLISFLNPLRKETQYTNINCFVGGFDVKNGLASTTALVLNTDRMVVVGEGEINLKTEGLNLLLKPVFKKGSDLDITGRLAENLGELARPFKLSGTLAKPSLAVDPTQTAIVVGKLFGGTTLFGPAGIAAALIGSNSNDENSCVTAISAAKKGVRTKKSSEGGNASKGAGQIFKDAGKGLNKLFGR